MRKIIVLTLLMGLICAPVFAATDWSDFESGRNNIRLDGYQGQPGYIRFDDGDGSQEGIIYWNDTANELYVITPDERVTSVALGTASSSKNVGVPLSSYTGSGLNP